jgi:hypothetical protein
MGNLKTAGKNKNSKEKKRKLNTNILARVATSFFKKS